MLCDVLRIWVCFAVLVGGWCVGGVVGVWSWEVVVVLGMVVLCVFLFVVLCVWVIDVLLVGQERLVLNLCLDQQALVCCGELVEGRGYCCFEYW